MQKIRAAVSGETRPEKSSRAACTQPKGEPTSLLSAETMASDLQNLLTEPLWFTDAPPETCVFECTLMDFLDVTDHLFLRSTKTRQDELRWFGPDPGADGGGPDAEKGGMWILKLMGELDKKLDVTAARLQYCHQI